MQTYFDLPLPIAQALDIRGERVTEADLSRLLKSSGCEIITSPSRIPFWEALPPEVSIKIVPENYWHNRRISLVAWCMLRAGVARRDLTALLKSPPKTERHRYWQAYQNGMRLLDEIKREEVEPLHVENSKKTIIVKNLDKPLSSWYN